MTEPDMRLGFQRDVDEVRAKSVAVVTDAVRAIGDATAALATREATAEALSEMGAADSTAQVAEVERQVLKLLALQQPVARDLRVLLTARDVAQLGELCLGLCLALARRASLVREHLPEELSPLVLELGEKTALLLRQANDAWSAVDADEAQGVIAAAGEAQALLRRLYTHLISLGDCPVPQAIELGTVVRVYERLADHAVDIASRVLFAANGTPSSHALRKLEDSLVGGAVDRDTQ